MSLSVDPPPPLFSDSDVKTLLDPSRISELINDAQCARITHMHPTVTERENILSIIIDFVHVENRIVYGGFALDSLLRTISPSDILYKRLCDQNIDIEFYSPTPIDDVIEICRRLAVCGYKYIRGKEAAHCNTFTISVGFVRLCDVTLAPITIYKHIPRLITSNNILIRKDLPINAVHPRFALLDLMNMLCDPFNSHWRLDTILQRIALIERIFPYPSSPVPDSRSLLNVCVVPSMPPPPPPPPPPPSIKLQRDTSSFVLSDKDFPPLSPEVVESPKIILEHLATETESSEMESTDTVSFEIHSVTEVDKLQPVSESTDPPSSENGDDKLLLVVDPMVHEDAHAACYYDALINLLKLQTGVVLVGDAAARYMGVVFDDSRPHEIHAMAAGGIFYDVLKQIQQSIPSIKWKRYASVLEILDERVEGFNPDNGSRVITLFDSLWRVVPSCGISSDGLRVASFTQTIMNAQALQFWCIMYDDVARFRHMGILMESLLRLRRDKIEEANTVCIFTDPDSVFRDFYLDYIGRPKHLMQVHMERTDERIAICGESEEPWFSFDPSRHKGSVNKQHNFPISDGREKCMIE